MAPPDLDLEALEREASDVAAALEWTTDFGVRGYGPQDVPNLRKKVREIRREMLRRARECASICVSEMMEIEEMGLTLVCASEYKAYQDEFEDCVNRISKLVDEGEDLFREAYCMTWLRSQRSNLDLAEVPPRTTDASNSLY